MARLARRTLLLAVIVGALALVPRNIGRTPTGDEPLLSADEAPLDPSAYRSAAAAMRRDDFEAARTLIDNLTTAEPERADEARVVLGLYAARAERHDLAATLLAETGDLLEDYRLLTYAESLAASGRTGPALEAFTTLVERDAPSPIRAHAILRAVETAGAEHPLDTLRFVERARSIELDPEDLEQLETTAWQLATDLGLSERREEAARELLTRFPLAASERDVIEIFRTANGLDWREILSTEQLFVRVESLLAADLDDGALQALDEIAAPDRDLRWTLLKARALTAKELGDAALALLQAAEPATAREQAEVAWRRARAALEVATARRGKAITSGARQSMRGAARGYLWDTVRADPAGDLAESALRVLYEELIEDDLFDEAIAVLQRLRALNPKDYTGAEHLWESGWSEYTKRNPSGAVGYWSQLRDLYPEHSRARSALYWTGRALEQLGNGARAQAIYRDVVRSPSTDFYSRYAKRRLRTTDDVVPPSDIERPAEFWPEDAALRRAEALHELGLDDLALLEIDSVAAVSDPRALNGLRAVVYASQGRRRDSIRSVWRAFPSLGRIAQDGVPERAQRLYYPLAFDDVIRQHAESRRLPVDLVFAMIRQESAFDAGAHSWAGARGLMQVMPATGRELAQKLGVPYSAEGLKEPGMSVLLGTEYFRQVLEMFDGNVELALAGYNGGPYRIKRLWRDAPPGTEIDVFVEGLGIRETRNYVKRILLFSDSYQRLYFQAG